MNKNKISILLKICVVTLLIILSTVGVSGIAEAATIRDNQFLNPQSGNYVIETNGPATLPGAPDNVNFDTLENNSTVLCSEHGAELRNTYDNSPLYDDTNVDVTDLYLENPELVTHSRYNYSRTKSVPWSEKANFIAAYTGYVGGSHWGRWTQQMWWAGGFGASGTFASINSVWANNQVSIPTVGAFNLGSYSVQPRKFIIPVVGDNEDAAYDQYKYKPVGDDGSLSYEQMEENLKSNQVFNRLGLSVDRDTYNTIISEVFSDYSESSEPMSLIEKLTKSSLDVEDKKRIAVEIMTEPYYAMMEESSNTGREEFLQQVRTTVDTIIDNDGNIIPGYNKYPLNNFNLIALLDEGEVNFSKLTSSGTDDGITDCQEYFDKFLEESSSDSTNGSDLKTKPEIIYDSIDVEFDKNTQCWIIGPLTMVYPDCGAFAGLTEVNLVTNLGIQSHRETTELSEVQPGEYIFYQGNKLIKDYPESGVPFNIYLKYDENITEINKFEFKCKYLKYFSSSSDFQVTVYEGVYSTDPIFNLTYDYSGKMRKQVPVDLSSKVNAEHDEYYYNLSNWIDKESSNAQYSHIASSYFSSWYNMYVNNYTWSSEYTSYTFSYNGPTKGSVFENLLSKHPHYADMVEGSKNSTNYTFKYWEYIDVSSDDDGQVEMTGITEDLVEDPEANGAIQAIKDKMKEDHSDYDVFGDVEAELVKIELDHYANQGGGNAQDLAVITKAKIEYGEVGDQIELPHIIPLYIKKIGGKPEESFRFHITGTVTNENREEVEIDKYITINGNSSYSEEIKYYGNTLPDITIAEVDENNNLFDPNNRENSRIWKIYTPDCDKNGDGEPDGDHTGKCKPFIIKKDLSEVPESMNATFWNTPEPVSAKISIAKYTDWVENDDKFRFAYSISNLDDGKWKFIEIEGPGEYKELYSREVTLDVPEWNPIEEKTPTYEVHEVDLYNVKYDNFEKIKAEIEEYKKNNDGNLPTLINSEYNLTIDGQIGYNNVDEYLNSYWHRYGEPDYNGANTGTVSQEIVRLAASVTNTHEPKNIEVNVIKTFEDPNYSEEELKKIYKEYDIKVVLTKVRDGEELYIRGDSKTVESNSNDFVKWEFDIGADILKDDQFYIYISENANDGSSLKNIEEINERKERLTNQGWEALDDGSFRKEINIWNTNDPNAVIWANVENELSKPYYTAITIEKDIVDKDICDAYYFTFKVPGLAKYGGKTYDMAEIFFGEENLLKNNGEYVVDEQGYKVVKVPKDGDKYYLNSKIVNRNNFPKGTYWLTNYEGILREVDQYGEVYDSNDVKNELYNSDSIWYKVAPRNNGIAYGTFTFEEKEEDVQKKIDANDSTLELTVTNFPQTYINVNKQIKDDNGDEVDMESFFTQNPDAEFKFHFGAGMNDFTETYFGTSQIVINASNYQNGVDSLKAVNILAHGDEYWLEEFFESKAEAEKYGLEQETRFDFNINEEISEDNIKTQIVSEDGKIRKINVFATNEIQGHKIRIKKSIPEFEEGEEFYFKVFEVIKGKDEDRTSEWFGVDDYIVINSPDYVESIVNIYSTNSIKVVEYDDNYKTYQEYQNLPEEEKTDEDYWQKYIPTEDGVWSSKIKDFKEPTLIEAQNYPSTKIRIGKKSNVQTDKKFSLTYEISNVKGLHIFKKVNGKRVLINDDQSQEKTFRETLNLAPGEYEERELYWSSTDEPKFNITENKLPDNWEYIGYEIDSNWYPAESGKKETKLELGKNITVLVKNEPKTTDVMLKKVTTTSTDDKFNIEFSIFPSKYTKKIWIDENEIEGVKTFSYELGANEEAWIRNIRWEGDSPLFTIKETDSKGLKLQNFIVDGEEHLPDDSNSYSDVLKNKKNFYINIVNTDGPDSSKFMLGKIFAGTNDELTDDDKKKEFEITLDIEPTGNTENFSINDEPMEKYHQTYTLKIGEEIDPIENIKWDGDAPKYTVTESDAEGWSVDGYIVNNLNINTNEKKHEGYLDAKTVKVLVRNKKGGPEPHSLKVSKIYYGFDQLTNDEKSKEFKIKVEIIPGEGTKNLSVEGKDITGNFEKTFSKMKINDTEVISEIYWDGENPTCVIKEEDSNGWKLYGYQKLGDGSISSPDDNGAYSFELDFSKDDNQEVRAFVFNNKNTNPIHVNLNKKVIDQKGNKVSLDANFQFAVEVKGKDVVYGSLGVKDYDEMTYLATIDVPLNEGQVLSANRSIDFGIEKGTTLDYRLTEIDEYGVDYVHYKAIREFVNSKNSEELPDELPESINKNFFEEKAYVTDESGSWLDKYMNSVFYHFVPSDGNGVWSGSLNESNSEKNIEAVNKVFIVELDLSKLVLKNGQQQEIEEKEEFTFNVEVESDINENNNGSYVAKIKKRSASQLYGSARWYYAGETDFSEENAIASYDGSKEVLKLILTKDEELKITSKEDELYINKDGTPTPVINDFTMGKVEDGEPGEIIKNIKYTDKNTDINVKLFGLNIDGGNPNSGYINLQKKITEKNSTEDLNFYFTLSDSDINEVFIYNNDDIVIIEKGIGEKEIEGSTKDYELGESELKALKLTVNAGNETSKVVTSNVFKWDAGAPNPYLYIKEIDQFGYTYSEYHSETAQNKLAGSNWERFKPDGSDSQLNLGEYSVEIKSGNSQVDTLQFINNDETIPYGFTIIKAIDDNETVTKDMFSKGNEFYFTVEYENGELLNEKALSALFPYNSDSIVQLDCDETKFAVVLTESNYENGVKSNNSISANTHYVVREVDQFGDPYSDSPKAGSMWEKFSVSGNGVWTTGPDMDGIMVEAENYTEGPGTNSAELNVSKNLGRGLWTNDTEYVVNISIDYDRNQNGVYGDEDDDTAEYKVTLTKNHQSETIDDIKWDSKEAQPRVKFSEEEGNYSTTFKVNGEVDNSGMDYIYIKDGDSLAYDICCTNHSGGPDHTSGNLKISKFNPSTKNPKAYQFMYQYKKDGQSDWGTSWKTLNVTSGSSATTELESWLLGQNASEFRIYEVDGKLHNVKWKITDSNVEASIVNDMVDGNSGVQGRLKPGGISIGIEVTNDDDDNKNYQGLIKVIKDFKTLDAKGDLFSLVKNTYGEYKFEFKLELSGNESFEYIYKDETKNADYDSQHQVYTAKISREIQLKDLAENDNDIFGDVKILALHSDDICKISATVTEIVPEDLKVIFDDPSYSPQTISEIPLVEVSNKPQTIQAQILRITNSYSDKRRWSVIMHLGGIVWEDYFNPEKEEVTERGLNSQYDGAESKDIILENIIVKPYKIIYQYVDGTEGTEGYYEEVARFDNSESNFIQGTDQAVFKTTNTGWFIDNVFVPLYNKSDLLWIANYDSNIAMNTGLILADDKASILDGVNKVIKAGYDIRYEIEFSYDGFKYEAVEFLVDAGGDAQKFVNDVVSEKNDYTKYLNDSHAKETNSRQYINDKYSTVFGTNPNNYSASDSNTGENPIVSEGYISSMDAEESEGTGKNPERLSIDYRLNNSTAFDTKYLTHTMYAVDGTVNVTEKDYVKASTIIEPRPLDEDGNAKLLDYEFPLVYPFNDLTSLDFNRYETVELPKIDPKTLTTYYEKRLSIGAYPYLENINLGLVPREKTKTTVEKNIQTATIIINNKTKTYRFEQNTDFKDVAKEISKELYPSHDIGKLLWKYDEIKNNDENKGTEGAISADFNIYTSDYLYRVDRYYGTDVEDAYDKFYKEITKVDPDYIDPIKAKELQVYLTFSVNIINCSSQYDIVINSIDDYVSKDLTYVDLANGYNYMNGDTDKGPGLWAYIDQDDYRIEADMVNVLDEEYSGIAFSKRFYQGRNEANNYSTLENAQLIEESESSISNLKKQKFDLKNLRINAGTNHILYLTYKVGTFSTFNDYMFELGPKENYAEIASFTPYYTGTNDHAGIIDMFSAPGDFNSSTPEYMELDTGYAVCNIEDYRDETRTVEGYAWADVNKDGKFDTKVNEGGIIEYENDERGLSNITTQLVEIIDLPVTADEEGNFTVFEEKIGDNPTKYTEFEYNWQDRATSTRNDGTYIISDITAGNYVTRFIYGDENTLNGGNLIGDKYLNGEDFKTTKYSDQYNNSLVDKYVANEWMILENRETNKNEARDNEARRLQIIKNNYDLDYEKTARYYSSNRDKSSRNQEDKNIKDIEKSKLYNDLIYDQNGTTMERTKLVTGQDNISTTMFADTAKMNFKVTLPDNQVNQQVNNNIINDNINGVNFGVMERPKTEMYLDKQIEEITLTSSSRTFFYIKYDIEYYTEEKDDRIKVADGLWVKLNVVESSVAENNQLLQAIDDEYMTKVDDIKDETEQEKTSRDMANCGISRIRKGFRYINVDSSILNELTMKIKYRISAFNLGETDYYSKALDDIYKVDEDTYNSKIDEFINERQSADYTLNSNGVLDFVNDGKPKKYGIYLSTRYYLESEDEDKKNDTDRVVGTSIRKVVDYVDNNIGIDKDYTTQTEKWMVINKDEQESVLGDLTSDNIWTNKYIVNDIEVPYTNILMSTDNGLAEGVDNNRLVKYMLPISSEEHGKLPLDKIPSTTVTETKRYASTEVGNTAVNNDAEILVITNGVGKRDEKTVHGNYKPRSGYKQNDDDDISTKLLERDESTSEMVTLSPPTGSYEVDKEFSNTIWKIVALAIIAGFITLGIKSGFFKELFRKNNK